MAALVDTVPTVPLRQPCREDYLVFGSPSIEEADIAAVVEALRSGSIGTGPRTAEFEQAFAEYVGVRHAVAVSSGTAALHLSLLAAGIGPGDNVIVPAMTFVGTANAVLHAGANPQLCDVDGVTGNLGVEDVDRVRTARTRAIVPVHFAGRPADLSALSVYAREHGLTIINDAAHAIEATHRGRSVAQFGTLTAYSFHAAKNLTTAEGGMVTTADAGLAERVRRLRRHGLTCDGWTRESGIGFRHYEAIEAGFNYNMTDLQASLGLRQLARIEQMNRRRRAIWKRYDDALAGVPLRRPAPVPLGDRHALHLYTVLLDLEALAVGRDAMAIAMHEARIGTGVHYRGVHLQPLYRERLGYEASDFPNATMISERTLSLPLSASMTDRDVDDVIVTFTALLQQFRR
jgi:dTDP-4-amino-4,6-dideoxygalactose transaminase